MSVWGWFGFGSGGASEGPPDDKTSGSDLTDRFFSDTAGDIDTTSGGASEGPLDEKETVRSAREVYENQKYFGFVVETRGRVFYWLYNPLRDDHLINMLQYLGEYMPRFNDVLATVRRLRSDFWEHVALDTRFPLVTRMDPEQRIPPIPGRDNLFDTSTLRTMRRMIHDIESIQYDTFDRTIDVPLLEKIHEFETLVEATFVSRNQYLESPRDVATSGFTDQFEKIKKAYEKLPIFRTEYDPLPFRVFSEWAIVSDLALESFIDNAGSTYLIRGNGRGDVTELATNASLLFNPERYTAGEFIATKTFKLIQTRLFEQYHVCNKRTLPYFIATIGPLPLVDSQTFASLLNPVVTIFSHQYVGERTSLFLIPDDDDPLVQWIRTVFRRPGPDQRIQDRADSQHQHLQTVLRRIEHRLETVQREFGKQTINRQLLDVTRIFALTQLKAKRDYLQQQLTTITESQQQPHRIPMETWRDVFTYLRDAHPGFYYKLQTKITKDIPNKDTFRNKGDGRGTDAEQDRLFDELRIGPFQLVAIEGGSDDWADQADFKDALFQQRLEHIETIRNKLPEINERLWQMASLYDSPPNFTRDEHDIVGAPDTADALDEPWGEWFTRVAGLRESRSETSFGNTLQWLRSSEDKQDSPLFQLHQKLEHFRGVQFVDGPLFDLLNRRPLVSKDKFLELVRIFHVFDRHGAAFRQLNQFYSKSEALQRYDWQRFACNLDEEGYRAIPYYPLAPTQVHSGNQLTVPPSAPVRLRPFVMYSMVRSGQHNGISRFYRGKQRDVTRISPDETILVRGHESTQLSYTTSTIEGRLTLQRSG